MLVRPTFIVEDITVFSLEQLRSKGIKGFIFDLDNTLIAPHTGVLKDTMREWLVLIGQEGFKTICVTNNKRPQYYNAAEKLINMPVIGHARKPARGPLLEAVQHMNLTPEQVIVVGDRPLTDIWGGQRIGAYTMLCDPLTKHTEPPTIQFLRKLERLFVKS